MVLILHYTGGFMIDIFITAMLMVLTGKLAIPKNFWRGRNRHDHDGVDDGVAL